MFYYRGAEIRVGDIIRTGNNKEGVVEKVIGPGSVDAEHYGCPEGGILIRERWDGVESLLLILPYRGDWEDLEVIVRKVG